MEQEEEDIFIVALHYIQDTWSIYNTIFKAHLLFSLCVVLCACGV